MEEAGGRQGPGGVRETTVVTVGVVRGGGGGRVRGGTSVGLEVALVAGQCHQCGGSRGLCGSEERQPVPDATAPPRPLTRARTWVASQASALPGESVVVLWAGRGSVVVLDECFGLGQTAPSRLWRGSRPLQCVMPQLSTRLSHPL